MNFSKISLKMSSDPIKIIPEFLKDKNKIINLYQSINRMKMWDSFYVWQDTTQRHNIGLKQTWCVVRTNN